MGSARFGDRKEPREPEKAGDLIIGRSGKSGKLLRYVGATHWNEEARALIVAIILHSVVHEPVSQATLATVRDKLTRDPQASRHYSPMCRPAPARTA